MLPIPVSTLPLAGRTRPRTALVASADLNFRQRLSDILNGLRWQVRQAEGGAQAWAEAETAPPEAVIVDSWLPDLDLSEFLKDFRTQFPDVDLVTASGTEAQESPRGPYRQELLYALHRSQDNDTAIWNTAPVLDGPFTPPFRGNESSLPAPSRSAATADAAALPPVPKPLPSVLSAIVPAAGKSTHAASEPSGNERLPELVGNAPCMIEVSRRIRLVAPRSTTVLIEGETGTGKEVVARALHRLSRRSAMPFVVLNCAAIPESLLEAELFGHVRGAFTGAVQSRMGRVEMASGGTLLLDEIGEMPVSMQAKMLRFLESGELQRVGDNKTTRVDVRLIAATHQPLERRSAEGTFRLDLYHRLAVFPIEVPPLRERMADLADLAEHFLALLGKDSPRKRIAPGALARLQEHSWPGNVRELMHVLERGTILAGVNPEIVAADIRYRRATRD